MVRASVIIIVLFYEITIVIYAFLNKSRRLNKGLRKLLQADFKTYVVFRAAGSELIFRSLVDPQGKYNPKSPPWGRCTNVDECYARILNAQDPAEFFFTYEHGLRYKLRNQCNGLTVFRPVSPLSPVSVGWYYGSCFPKDKQIAIDKDILGRRMQHKLQDLLNKENPTRCESSKDDNIKPVVLGIWLVAISFVGIGTGCIIPLTLAIRAFYRRVTEPDIAGHVQ